MNKHELAEKISHLVVAAIDDGPITRSRSFLPVRCSIPVAPGQFAMIPARPQCPFRGDRLAVWSKVAPMFFIEDVRVNNQSLPVAAGSAPAEVFATRLDLLPVLDQQLDAHGFVQVRVSRKAEECFGQPLAFPLADVGADIILTVQNVSDLPATFIAVILGDIEYK